MTLGEKIYTLRTKQNLSQGDLADRLDVSRQSISKWETGNSVPDLDKLIKLSRLFHVTLDELVLDKSAEPESSSAFASTASRQPDTSQPDAQQNFTHTEPQPKSSRPEATFPPRKLAGTILFCMAFIVVLVSLIHNTELLLFSIPFLICGIICFAFRHPVGLWCAWAVFFMVDFYFALGTGRSWSNAIRWIIIYKPDGI